MAKHDTMDIKKWILCGFGICVVYNSIVNTSAMTERNGYWLLMSCNYFFFNIMLLEAKKEQKTSVGCSLTPLDQNLKGEVQCFGPTVQTIAPQNYSTGFWYLSSWGSFSRNKHTPDILTVAPHVEGGKSLPGGQHEAENKMTQFLSQMKQCCCWCGSLMVGLLCLCLQLTLM